MMISNADFEKHLDSVARNALAFKPSCHYDKDGDCLEFLASGESFYAERVDDVVTVYYSQETDEIIGSMIKGVSRLTQRLSKQMPGFAIQIQDGRVKLEHLFLATLWSDEFDPNSCPTDVYRKLIDMAEKTQAESELSCV